MDPAHSNYLIVYISEIKPLEKGKENSTIFDLEVTTKELCLNNYNKKIRMDISQFESDEGINYLQNFINRVKENSDQSDLIQPDKANENSLNLERNDGKVKTKNYTIYFSVTDLLEHRTIFEIKNDLNEKVGFLIFDEFKITKIYSFSDFLNEGLEIQSAIAIDFSKSNKAYNDPNSLHSSITGKLNRKEFVFEIL